MDDDAGSIGGGAYALERLIGGGLDELEGGGRRGRGHGRRGRRGSRSSSRGSLRGRGYEDSDDFEGGLRADYDYEASSNPERVLADLQVQMQELQRAMRNGAGSSYRPMVRSREDLKNTIVVRDCPIGTVPCPLTDIGLGCPVDPDSSDPVFVLDDGSTVCASQSGTARRLLGRDLGEGEKLTFGMLMKGLVDNFHGMMVELGETNPKLLREILESIRAKNAAGSDGKKSWKASRLNPSDVMSAVRARASQVRTDSDDVRTEEAAAAADEAVVGSATFELGFGGGAYEE